jgi:hypothetical protein
MRRKFNIYDVGMITVIIIIISVYLIFFGNENMVSQNEKTVYVYSNNELIGEYILRDDFKDEIEIESANGGYNTLHIEDGQIWVHDASCPDKVCITQGRISENGEMIVCLPNQMLIKIIDKGE